MDTDIHNIALSHHHHMNHSRIDTPSDVGDGDGEGEGVWSPDIEECFREALEMFPPCGRRKHILPEEGGKMYGRNELIARHIKQRTGKLRTRKQVSSHIQVLARRKAKTEAHVRGSSNGVSPSPSSIGSGGQPQSAHSIKQEEQMQQLHMQLSNAAHHQHHQQQQQQQLQQQHLIHNSNHLYNHHHQQQQQTIGNPSSATATAAAAAAALCHPAATGTGSFYPGITATSVANSSGGLDLWLDRPIVTSKIRLVEFSAFIEHRQTTVSDTTSSTSSLSSSTSTYYDPNNRHLNTSSSLSTNGTPSNHHSIANHLKQSSSSSSTNNGTAIRHSYVQIDYRYLQSQSPAAAATSSFFAATAATSRSHHLQSRAMLESINIKQIHDKLPGFAGPDGYMQRGLSDAFYLVKFWANLDSGSDFDFNMEDRNSSFGFSSIFETIEPYRSLTCSTKACSYGSPAVEKVEKIYGTFNQTNGRYSYNLDRIPMCEFMIQFIKKLRQLPTISLMNSVLENFTVLQVIENDSLPVPEVLLCLAYVFEVASSEQQNNGPSYHVYKLTQD